MVVCSTMKNSNDNHNEDNLVYGIRLSSVGSATVTGNLAYEPNNMDLAMKVHYLRVVYFLDSQAIEGLIPFKLKEAIFAWLCYYYESCGRFRRSEEDGRPFIKCNDCGVRFVEAKSSKTLDEWIQMEDTSSQRLLVADNVLGPELTFSPLVFLQITSFKCGGLSLGLSWAHVLGDAFSAANYMNTLALFLNGLKPKFSPSLNKKPARNLKPNKPINSDPSSLKIVGPLGDHWIMPFPCEMGTISLHLKPTQLTQLQAKFYENDSTLSPIQSFEMLSAVIWRAIARIKDGPEPNTVTVIKKDAASPIEDAMALRNNQFVGSVKAEFSIGKAHPKELAALIQDRAESIRDQIEEVVGRDPGGCDCIIYGSNLTFVNLEEVDFYGFELKGLSPRFVNCFVDGVGEEGVVLVLPSPKDINDKSNAKTLSGGRTVTIILPKNYMVDLKKELKEWGLSA
ncbi:protein ECERIFERUM 26-like [Chenopodium quinoa]|nr:protein ECERIFERUM 26-like [Chenopodium quinoa]